MIPIEVARQYELAFKDVKKAVDGTPEQLATLREEMKAFKGASFEELSAIASEAGKAGLSAENAMEFTESIVKTAKALDFSAKEAVAQVGQILTFTNQMDTAITSTQDIADKATHLENSMPNVKASGMLDIWSRNADLYAQLDFDNEKMAGMSAFSEQNSVSSELGASSFNMMINTFKKFEGKLGFIEKIKTNGMQGLQDVMQEIGKSSAEDNIKKYGTEAMGLIDKLQNAKNMEKLQLAIELSKNSKGAVEKEWAIFRATYDEKVNDLKKNVKNTMDSIGRPMMKISADIMDTISPIIEKIGNFAKENKELMVTIGKIALYVGGFVAVMGILYVVFGLVAMSVGVFSGILTAFTIVMKAVTVVTWLMNTALWANPITWIVAGVIALIVAVGLLIYYFQDIVTWVGTLWDKFTGFIGSLNLVENAIAGVKSYFEMLTAPIKYVIDLIDSFLSKFEIFNKAKEKVGEYADSAGEVISDGWSSTKNFFGFGDDDEEKSTVDEGINTVPKNQSVIEVRVTAEQGATADTTAKSTGAVNLKNMRG
jgi:TP901 family phage tail tape measure protein